MSLQSHKTSCEAQKGTESPYPCGFLGSPGDLPLSVKSTLQQELLSFPYELKSEEPPLNENGGCELADIFKLYWSDFQSNNRVTPRQYKVVYDILHCRSGDFGYSVNVCDTCGHTELFANSCRNSHCPKCQGRKRQEWVDARMEELLPVPYFHCVFTIPNRIFPFCLFNQKLVYDLLFSSVAETLHEFGYDPKWAGGKSGFFMVLHTWGQQLPVHPHVHCVIPGGAYDETTGEWIHHKYERNNFLYPVKALSRVFRGKFVSGLEDAFCRGELNFPEELASLGTFPMFKGWLRELVFHDWVVYAKRPFSSPENVVRYVGMYTHRVAISNNRLISCDNGVVRFWFKNYKRLNEVEHYNEIWEEMELTADEFIRRFLHHVMPKGFNRIRYYGFLSNNNKELLEKIQHLLLTEKESELPSNEPKAYTGIPCPRCETGVLMPFVILDGCGNILNGDVEEFIDFRRERERRYNREPKSVEVLDSS